MNTRMSRMKLEKLLAQEDSWMNQEGLVEDHDRWLEEGIELYRQFIRLGPLEQRQAVTLAGLYLQRGRDEKMRRGNYRAAYDILRQATIHAPERPDAFYHISFILAEEERKWEAVLFYGKEALEQGLAGGRKVKLLCNMAVGYARLGYGQKALDCMKEARRLDAAREHGWFIRLYEDRLKKQGTEPILLKEPEESRKQVSKQDAEQEKEAAMEGRCLLLDLAGDERHFYGQNDAVRLTVKEAQILGFLMEHDGTPCTRKSIEEAVWQDRELSASALKRHIFSIRQKIAQATGRSDVAESLLLTAPDGSYCWAAELKPIVLRRV